ncbi:hypothetical protein VPNG_00069 [Cytospora leucostoma]|uniref:DUF3074 domain-containing protein n=1 Tax=Cytospora leucostoma TaxID=1230097 RepID=A0A423XNK1_9PEZI|nr:hypothetical protein VPNG_00069 [Cytospora leucostoma]
MSENNQPRLLRLAGLRTSQLPPPSATASDLRPFVTALLREAVPFIDTAAPRSGPAPPNTPWRSRGAKAQPGSDAKVEISERNVAVVAVDDDDDGTADGGGGGGGDDDGDDADADGVALAPTSNSNDIVSDMILGESDQGVLEATVSASATYSRGSDGRKREREREKEKQRMRRRSTAGIVPTAAAAAAAARDDDDDGSGRKKMKNKKKKTATNTTTTNEFWACRRSVHADSPTRGTASWAEFADCIRDLHAETEDAFTPGVMAHRTAVTWEGGSGGGGGGGAPGQGQGLRDLVVEAGGIAWGGLGLQVVEMKHKVPGPLRPRVFPVLQLVASAVAAPVGGAVGGDGDGDDGITAATGAATTTATATTATTTATTTTGHPSGAARDEFIVVSVTISDLAEGSLREQASLSAEKGVVVGAYAAVERVRRLPPPPPPGSSRGGREIEWLMATASDAKGMLPMWVQTRAVPGQIAKDVGLFLGWIARERGRGKRRVGRGVGVGEGGGGDGDGDGDGEGVTAVGVEG